MIYGQYGYEITHGPWGLPTTLHIHSCAAPRFTQINTFSFSMLGHVVAGGGPGQLVFWDRRTHKVLATWSDTHMDDVTQAGAASVH